MQFMLPSADELFRNADFNFQKVLVPDHTSNLPKLPVMTFIFPFYSYNNNKENYRFPLPLSSHKSFLNMSVCV